jgi:hypothetical protein
MFMNIQDPDPAGLHSLYSSFFLQSILVTVPSLRKTSSLNGEGSSRVSNTSVAEMAASGAAVTTAAADSIRGTAELLDLVGRQARDSLALQWVTEHDGSCDVRRRDTVRESVVYDHAALAVARNDDLGSGALLQCLLDVLSHNLAAVAAQVGVTLTRR